MITTGYLGKKVNIICKDGAHFSGYVSDISDAEDSDIGCESIEISPVEEMHMIEIAVEDIANIMIDANYREYDFRH